MRCQTRLRGHEKALARFVQLGKADEPRLHSKHQDLLLAIATSRNDIVILEGMMRREFARPFDLLTAKVMADA